jgi:hypothetical protein
MINSVLDGFKRAGKGARIIVVSVSRYIKPDLRNTGQNPTQERNNR